MSYMDPRFHLRRPTLLFSLNDKELAIAKSLRHRGQRYMLVVLLGYFKAKPVVLNPAFIRSSRTSNTFINVLPGPGCRPFNLTKRTNGFTNVFSSSATTSAGMSKTMERR